MIYGYIRVSTDKQSVESQKNTISRYCIENKLMIDEWYSVEMSTSKSMEKRLVTELIDKLTPDDTVIVTECSRFARSTTEFYFNTDRIALEKKAIFICLHPFMELNTGNVNSLDNVIKRAWLSTSAQMEKVFLSYRTKNGLCVARASGKRLGCPPGITKKSKYDKDRERIFDLYKMHVPVQKISSLHLKYGTARTLYTYIKKRYPDYIKNKG